MNDPALSNPRLLNSKATAIISAVYGMGASDADPRAILFNTARSTTVIGKLLEGLADEYEGIGKKIAGGVTTAGRLFWGLVEVSIPESVLYYLCRNWIWVLELLSVLIIGLGILAGTPAMWSMGIALLVLVFSLYQIRHAFHRYMVTDKFPWNVIKLLTIVVAGFLILVGLIYVSVHDGKNIAEFLAHVEVFLRSISKS